jgi:bacillithiol system protein YtxJ
MSTLTPLTDVASLDAAIEESHLRPVLLFKHSRTCGISCEAMEEIHAHIAGAGETATYRVVTAQTHRRVADEIAVRFGIRHETPQVILLRQGQPTWSASHFRITARQLDAVLRPASDPAAAPLQR